MTKWHWKIDILFLYFQIFVQRFNYIILINISKIYDMQLNPREKLYKYLQMPDEWTLNRKKETSPLNLPLPKSRFKKKKNKPNLKC